jgi:thioredoxin reductase (NADPH)
MRFGQMCAFAEGEYLSRTGEIGLGMFVIISGHLAVAEHDGPTGRGPIVTHGPGDRRACGQ